MALQQFTAGQTLTASQMNTLQSNDFNFTRKLVTVNTYVLELSDRGQVLEFQNAGGTVVTVPLASSVAFAIGDSLEILNASSSTVQIDPAAGVSINATGGLLTLSAQWQKIQLIKLDTNSWVLSGLTSVAILDSTIINADIASNAAIELSKLANATAGQVLLGTTTTGVVTATTITGDVTVTGAGVTAISSNSIVNADVSTSAAIGLGKLADATIDIKTVNYPLVLSDKNKFIKMNSSSNRTITVPLQATVDFPEGSQIHLIRYGSGTLEIVGESGAVILYATPGKFLRAQYSSATLLKCADTNVWMLMGDLSVS